ncbi:universal stress protein [Mesorhizobium sp.]|uniref:universal stress protein n=1 Tax=Mesorhizobium sp. TaxID=1871066 RepID=UPI0025E5168B|nr:universal stress protein [Mesorhizobium sp.]
MQHIWAPNFMPKLSPPIFQMSRTPRRGFLERASKVTVLTVVGEKPLMAENGAERLAAGLTKRGLIAEATPISTEDYPVGIGLQVHAIARGASLLVMGGYGHSVVRDFVLGGATEDVLDDLRLPVLFSH